MADQLRFHPLVANDPQDALAWYDQISVQLGDQFRDEVDARLDSIELMADSWPIAFDDIRFARLRRFPYLLLFRVTAKQIRVLGLFHSASHPDR